MKLRKKKNHIETILELIWTRNVSVNHKKKNIKLNIADGESLMISHSETEIYSGIQRGWAGVEAEQKTFGTGFDLKLKSKT